MPLTLSCAHVAANDLYQIIYVHCVTTHQGIFAPTHLMPFHHSVCASCIYTHVPLPNTFSSHLLGLRLAATAGILSATFSTSSALVSFFTIHLCRGYM